MANRGLTVKSLRTALESTAAEVGAKTLVSGIIFLAFTILEQFYVEEAFKCRCYNYANVAEKFENCSKY